MFSIARSLIDRFKSLFITHAALELEAELIAAAAERKAALLRRAEQYEKEGLPAVAEDVRRQAERLMVDKPLSSTLEIIAHLQASEAAPARPSERGIRSSLPSVAADAVPTASAKKSRKS
jgi:hypothetical protein